MLTGFRTARFWLKPIGFSNVFELGVAYASEKYGFTAIDSIAEWRVVW